MTEAAPPRQPRTFADNVVAYAQAGWPCLPLPDGLITVVDPHQHERLARYDWRLSSGAYVRATVDGHRTFLHRLITGAQADQVVDHINHNPLDNRRLNLRVCTTAQNLANKRQQSRVNTSGYKGVVWRPARGKWEAAIQPRGRVRFLGRFDDPWEAAQAYNAAALELYGEFAELNQRIEVAQ